MADDKSKRAPRDASRISLEEDYEVKYWTKALGISRQQLAEIVQRVGSSADAVRRELAKV